MTDSNLVDKSHGACPRVDEVFNTLLVSYKLSSELACMCCSGTESKTEVTKHITSEKR